MRPFEALFTNQTFLPQKPLAKWTGPWDKEKDSTLQADLRNCIKPALQPGLKTSKELLTLTTQMATATPESSSIHFWQILVEEKHLFKRSETPQEW